MANLPSKGTPPANVPKSLLTNTLDADEVKPENPTAIKELTATVKSVKPLEFPKTPSRQYKHTLTLSHKDFDVTFKYAEVAETAIAFLFIVDADTKTTIRLKNVMDVVMTTDQFGHEHTVTYIGEPVLFESLDASLLILLKDLGENN